MKDTRAWKEGVGFKQRPNVLTAHVHPSVPEPSPLLLGTVGTLDRCALRGPQYPRLAPPLAQNRATRLSLEAWAARASFQKTLFLVKNSTDVFPGMAFGRERDC